jgi:ABC-type lipoprotein export system ATPase subunit
LLLSGHKVSAEVLAAYHRSELQRYRIVWREWLLWRPDDDRNAAFTSFEGEPERNQGRGSPPARGQGRMVAVQSAIEVRALAQQAKSGVVTLHDVSLDIGAGELVAIIGGSGSGKTTLLDTMCGLRPPVAGAVTLISGNIGYVPQDDVIHLALPLARTLRYAAALRAVPGDSVDKVLRTLELTGRSLVPVGQLSGGERKRASIASELLAAPTLFFLDEPTSGLISLAMVGDHPA